MPTFTVTFGQTQISPGSSSPNVVGGPGGDDLLVLDMSTAPTGYHFIWAHVLDLPGIVQFPNASGSYYWSVPAGEPARHGVSFSGIERFHILGGGGNDFLVSGNGDDTVQAGAGNDDIFTQAGSVVVDGGDGIDQWSANYSAATSDIAVDLTANSLSGVAGSLSGIERLGYAANLYSSFNTGSGNDTIDTTACS